MPAFRPAYLIHGNDHGRIAERRARLRSLAEAESGVAGVELFEGDMADPDAVAAALSAMTFALGRRFIVVDGAERWKDKQLDALTDAMRAILPETTVVFFAREEGRTAAPERLHKAVRDAGGEISAEQSVKPWELPKWVSARAGELGLALGPDAAKALVAQVGERQQRLLRELEKLSLAAPQGMEVDVSTVEELASDSAERRMWSLADALVAGEATAATRLYLTLRAQGERVSGLIYWVAQRLQVAHEIARALDAGESAAQIKRGLRMPSRAADRLIADARARGQERLRVAIEEVADLELTTRGGAGALTSEDTAALRAIQRIAA